MNYPVHILRRAPEDRTHIGPEQDQAAISRMQGRRCSARSPMRCSSAVSVALVCIVATDANWNVIVILEVVGSRQRKPIPE